MELLEALGFILVAVIYYYSPGGALCGIGCMLWWHTINIRRIDNKLDSLKRRTKIEEHKLNKLSTKVDNKIDASLDLSECSLESYECGTAMSEEEERKKKFSFSVYYGLKYGLDKKTWGVIQMGYLFIKERPSLEDLDRIKDEIIKIRQSRDMPDSDETRTTDLVARYATCLVIINYDLKYERGLVISEGKENFDNFYKNVQDITEQVCDHLEEGNMFIKSSLRMFIKQMTEHLDQNEEQLFGKKIFIDWFTSNL